MASYLAFKGIKRTIEGFHIKKHEVDMMMMLPTKKKGREELYRYIIYPLLFVFALSFTNFLKAPKPASYLILLHPSAACIHASQFSTTVLDSLHRRQITSKIPCSET